LRNVFKLALVLLAQALTACATAPRQAKNILENPPRVSRSHSIDAVPFIEQQAAQCGPATMAMVLEHYGVKSDLNVLVAQILTENKKGSLQSNMVSGARRQGMMAMTLSGFSDLLREVDAGHPVIVFENLALSWWPQWHYAVVYGYDLDRQLLYMHSGKEKNLSLSFDRFESDWSLGDYWGLVVVPPQELSASADELNHMNSAAVLENLGKKNEAEKAYTALLSRWPQSLGAHLGLANIYFSRADYKKSVDTLKRAQRFHPDSPTLKHNYSVALKKLNE
jgi:tetratricopeptide (TPR) repeat protein